jgi:hypothetical protein
MSHTHTHQPSVQMTSTGAVPVSVTAVREAQKPRRGRLLVRAADQSDGVKFAWMGVCAATLAKSSSRCVVGGTWERQKVCGSWSGYD